MKPAVDVSIIVVNWNVRELLDACLTSVRRHPPARGACEVHVVDNASSDGSAEMVRSRHPEATLTVNTENVGFGRANNQALAACRGEFVLLLNPDAELLEGAADALVEAMRSDPAIGVAGARLLNHDGSFQRGCGGALPRLRNVAWHCLRLDKALPRRWKPPSLFYDEDEAARLPMAWVSGAAMLIRRSAIGDHIFDERFFMYGEDIELCARIADRGLKVAYVDHAHLLHHMSASLRRQTSEQVHAALVKGPRAFFRMRYGPWWCAVYDAVVLTGYLMRWFGFGAADVVRPGIGHGDRALSARRSAIAAAGVMLRR